MKKLLFILLTLIVIPTNGANKPLSIAYLILEILPIAKLDSIKQTIKEIKETDLSSINCLKYLTSVSRSVKKGQTTCVATAIASSTAKNIIRIGIDNTYSPSCTASRILTLLNTTNITPNDNSTET
jgi:hypothetical protein